MPGGAFFGANIAGHVSDRFGRKPSIIFATIFWIIGCILSCAAQNVGMLIVGRFVKGICVGWCSSQVPVYLAEQAPKVSHPSLLPLGSSSALTLSPQAIRGRLVSCQQFAVTIGILVMFYLSYGCSFIPGPTSFRLAWGLQMIPGFLLAVGMLFLPESSRWLAAHGRWDEAENVIARIHNQPLDAPLVAYEITELREAMRLEKEAPKVTYGDMFAKRLRSRTIAGISCQLWSQLVGMNVMMYYIVVSTLRCVYSHKFEVLTCCSSTSSKWRASLATPTSYHPPSK